MNGMSPIPADMSDSVKQKRLIHCPLFLWGGSYAGPQLLTIAAIHLQSRMVLS
jgi:hypothetical protein